jgi:acetyl esterase/lipase
VTTRTWSPELEIVLPVDADDIECRSEVGFDAYRALASAGARPIVLFVHGDADPETLRDAKDWGQYRSWARLVASRGFVGVTFNHASTGGWTAIQPVIDEISEILRTVRSRAASVGGDPERVAVWAGSAGVPFGFVAAAAAEPAVQAIVACYGPLDLGPSPAMAPFSPIRALTAAGPSLPPTLVVKAALDRDDINASIDSFVARAAAFGAPVELVVHDAGHHAFDILDDDDRSREVIERIVAFLARELGVRG